jgi:antitoxin component of MazEF toxin-antitoxin module
MGYKTKVQLIKRARSQQWYVCFPSALAQAMEFTKSEVVEWVVETQEKLILRRPSAKKSRHRAKDARRRQP